MTHVGDPAHLEGMSMSPLVGRERELASLRRAFGRMLEGRGGLVLISGEAGIGKTSLVEAFTSETAADQPHILHGYCYDLITTPPYGLWIEVTDRYRQSDGMPELPEVLQRGTGIGDLRNQTALFEVAQDFLDALTRVKPLVLVLEDLHWSDQASLDLLRYLARHLDARRILMVATFRDDEVTRQHPLFRLMPALVRESSATRIELRALDRGDVTTLVRAHWTLQAQDEDRLVRYLLAHAEGRPLFTVEVLRTLEQDGLIRHSEDGWLVSDLSRVPVPPLVRQVIEGRVTQLGEEARYYLEVAAVIGHQVQLDVWQEIAGLTESDMLSVLDQAIRLHLLAATGDSNVVSFVHALTREALYTDILPPRRRLWHRLIAEALAGSPDPNPDIVAHHFSQAGDSRALDWLIRAGNRAESIWALQTVSERFDAAQALLARDSTRAETRAWLLFRLARSVRFTEHERSLAYLQEAERIAKDAANESLRIVCVAERGFIACIAGEFLQALELIEPALAEFDALPVKQWESETATYLELFETGGGPEYVSYERDLNVVMESRRSLIVGVLATTGHFRESMQLRETWAPRWSGPVLSGVRVNALGGWALCEVVMGRPEQAYRDHRERTWRSVEINNFIVAASHVGDDLFWRHLSYRADDVEERQRLLNEMLTLYQLAADYGNAALPPTDSHLHPFQLLEGNWTAAQSGAGTLLARPQGQTYWHARARWTLATLARHQGQTDRAWAQVRTMLPDGPESEPGRTLFMESTLMQRLAVDLALDSSDLTLARAWLGAYERWLDESGVLLGRAEALLRRGQLLEAEGEVESARQYAEQALQRASNPRQPLALIAIDRFLGELAANTGNREVAQQHLQQSLDLATACAFPFERALTLLARAELLATTGDPDGAGELLAEVRRIAEPLQAAPTLRRCDALDGHLRRPVAKPPYPDGLTAREVDVLRLIAAGKSSRDIADALFLSPRTVERHTANIYQKIDVHSKAEAAIYAVRHGITAERG